MNRRILSTVLAVTMASAGAGCSVGPDQGIPGSMSFGVLGSTCAPDRLAALRDAGISVVELPLAWDRYQPVDRRVDRHYVAQVQQQLADCRDAGMQVVLSPGMHYPPKWVRKLPGGSLKGSAGGTPKKAGAELVFSAKVRETAHDYLAGILPELGFNGIAAIRVGTNAGGELGYPGPDDGGHEGEFWAFGDAPQSGKGLAEGVSPSPMPGWVPGSPSWNGSSVTDGQVQGWWDWYARSVVDAVAWQIHELRELGYQGRVHVPVAGRGVLPADKAKAIKGRLDGRANPDGAQERGLDYPAQFAVLSTLPGVDVDFTGLDDISAVEARNALPPQDQCHPSDDDDVLHDSASLWSSHRYTSALARRAGLGLVGENPGPADWPFTGGSPRSDSLSDQLRRAPQYAKECGMTMFLFGFEACLFEGKEHNESGVNVDDYKKVIQETRALQYPERSRKPPV
ncbi:hypothetical protein AUT26_03425 [[Arthrobacter] sp. ATCC 21022]|nr:hypothetical protein AUT26_03425 [Arthrobacter sp. ATCC 21022]KUR63179.1 hypothetical protein JM67_18510 [Arthrobacter sp. ATCC 21022]